jgi:hypothetical protein
MDRVLYFDYNPIVTSVSNQEPFGTFGSVDGNSGQGSATEDNNSVYAIGLIILLICVAFRKME